MSQKAFLTFWIRRLAYTSAQPDDVDIIKYPVIPGQFFHEVELNFHRVFFLGMT